MILTPDWPASIYTLARGTVEPPCLLSTCQHNSSCKISQTNYLQMRPSEAKFGKIIFYNFKK